MPPILLTWSTINLRAMKPFSLKLSTFTFRLILYPLSTEACPCDNTNNSLNNSKWQHAIISCHIGVQECVQCKSIGHYRIAESNFTMCNYLIDECPIQQGWQKAGFYSYCPGRRLLPALTGFYWLLPAFTGFK